MGGGLIVSAVLEAGSTMVKAGLDVSYEEGVRSVTDGTKTVPSAMLDLTVDIVAGMALKGAQAYTKKAVDIAEREVAATLKVVVKAQRKLTKNVARTGGYGVKATVRANAANSAKAALNQARSTQVRKQLVNGAAEHGVGQAITTAVSGIVTDAIKSRKHVGSFHF